MVDIVSQSDFLSFGQGAELVQALVRQGLTPVMAQRVIENQELAAKTVEFVGAHLRTDVTSWTQAKKLMPDCAFGIQLARRLGFKVTEADVSRFSQVPFNQEELTKAYKAGFYLVAMPRVSLRTLYENGEHRFNGNVKWFINSVHDRRTMAREGWHLLRVLPGSDHKTWLEQASMIPDDESVLSLPEMAYWVVCALSTGIQPFSRSVRTYDVDMNGDRVVLEVFRSLVGVTVAYADYRAEDILGVASGIHRPLVLS